MNRWTFAFFGLILLAGAFAQNGTGNGTRPDTLGLKYDLMECRVNAVITLVEYGEDATGLDSGDLVDELNSDLDTLKGYADSGDRPGFNVFMWSDLRDDLYDAVMYLKDVKRELVGGGHDNETGPSEGKDEWTDMHQQVMQERAECIQSAALDFARGQENEFEERLRNMEQTVEKLKNKSVDTSEMEDILDEAYENLDELSDAIDTGNESTIFDTVRSIREEHLHIWARFHIAKVNAILDAIEDEADAEGYGDEVDEIRELMDSIEPLVEPGRPYNPGEFGTVQGTLWQAHERLRELIRDLNQGGNA